MTKRASDRKVWDIPLFLCALWLSILSGCASTSGTAPATEIQPYFDFKAGERKSIVDFVGVLEAASSTPIMLDEGAWGIVKWLQEEGKVVASGDLIVKIDMSESEEGLRYSTTSLRHSRDQAHEHEIKSPLELRKEEVEVGKKKSELEHKINELALLQKGAPWNERARMETDVEKAKIELYHAKKMLEFQRNVSERGFDNPFSLRKQEIELKSKEIEQDYSFRSLEKIRSGPFPEEVAKARFEVEVASGEAWLAANQFLSASVSQGLETKSYEFQVELNSSELRRCEERLKQRVINAPSPGLVIYPLLWGSEKVAPGAEVWQGLTFLKIVGTETFQLDAAVDETVSSLIKPGIPMDVEFDSFPGKICRGKISFVGKSPRRIRGRRGSEFKKFPIQVSVDVGSLPVKLGIKARARGIVGSGTGVFLPREAVQGSEASPTVTIKTLFGSEKRDAVVEPFDADFLLWKNPPASEGTVLY